MAGGRGVKRAMPAAFLENCRIFENANALSENFRTFAVSKDKVSNFIRKSLNLAPYCKTTDVFAEFSKNIMNNYYDKYTEI